MSRKRLIDVINFSNADKADNEIFLSDVTTAIERYDKLCSRKPSQYYKPSSLNCLRQMYFTRIGENIDDTITPYSSIGMADTGSRRHEAIQQVLSCMKGMGYNWEYVDVADYVDMKHEDGKCLNIKVEGKRGAETKLFDEVYQISFLCDGIIKKLSTNEYYLFEFKNQVSFKLKDKNKVDDAHINQVTAYCAELDLDKALVLYENRDTCILKCPEIFEVTPQMKQKFYSKILECEDYVEHLKVPPKNNDETVCKWCKYKLACRKAGN